jgi:hypothetical protein
VRVELSIQQGRHSTLNSYLEKLLFLLTGSCGVRAGAYRPGHARPARCRGPGQRGLGRARLGSPVVWSLAGHHPHRSHAAANRCVPYCPAGFTPASFLSLVDRKVYPEAECPAGQWDYQLFYQEHFDRTRAFFEANVPTPCRPCAAKGTPRGGASRREPHWCARRAAASVAPARHQPAAGYGRAG